MQIALHQGVKLLPHSFNIALVGLTIFSGAALSLNGAVEKTFESTSSVDSLMTCDELNSIYFFVSENHLRFQIEGEESLRLLRDAAFENVATVLLQLGHPFAAANFERTQSAIKNKILKSENLGDSLAPHSLTTICDHLGNPLYRTAYLKALIRQLDPYSDFMASEELDIKTSSVDGEFTGVGIGSEPFGDYLRVMEVLKGGPADGKILVNDLIKNIDGHSVVGLSDAEIRYRIRGPKNSVVRFQGLRGMTPFDTLVTRAVINQPSLTHSWTEDKILALRVHRFYKQTAAEVEAILRIHASNAKGILLDLRNNPGGLLQAARDLVDLFITQGVVVYLKGKEAVDQVWALDEGGFTDIPLVILVNENTASAAEIVAGALQDYGRGLVIGQKTFGKASVQNIYETKSSIGTSYRGGLKLTTLWYYLPSGRNAGSLSPDISMPDSEAMVKRVAMPYKGPDTIRLAHPVKKMSSVQSKDTVITSSDHEAIGRRLLRDRHAVR